MFKGLHRKLTFFCTLVTGIILVAMSCVCLYITEKSIYQSSAAEYASAINAISSHIESQTTISQQWLAQMEGNGKYVIRIYDNGNEFLYNRTHADDVPKEVIDFARQTTARIYKENNLSTETDSRLMQQVSGTIQLKDYDSYSITEIILPKDTGNLNVLIMCPQAPVLQRIHQQRWLFAGVDIAAILLLGVFAWFFTRHLIRPIEENRRRQTEFIAAASHELRSPLTVILSGMTALKAAPPEKAPDFIRTIENEGHRMAGLIDDMLALARADNQSWSLDTRLCDADTLLLEAYEKFEPLARQKQIAIDIQLPPEPLPQVDCDPVRISQVLSVLVDNALAYVPGGGQIYLSAVNNGSRLELMVIDNGPGIPDGEKEKIFERFYRMDQAHKDKQHFGLGLCIAREIVNLHHGSLTVEDATAYLPQLPHGAAFIISLPADAK